MAIFTLSDRATIIKSDLEKYDRAVRDQRWDDAYDFLGYMERETKEAQNQLVKLANDAGYVSKRFTNRKVGT